MPLSDPAERAAIRTLLILKPSSLGDIVHTLPVASLIKRAMPDTRLRWLVNPEWAPLLEGNRDIDEVIIFPRRELGGIHRVGKQIRWLKKLRTRYRSDWVLDFQGLLRSAIMGRAARGRRLLGLSDAREGARHFYDAVAEVNRDGHAIERYLGLARLIGVERDAELTTPLPQGSAPAGFEMKEPFLLLHPYSRGKGKSLLDAEILELCERVNGPVVLAGMAGGDRVIPRLPKVRSLVNATTLPELIWLIRQARFVVSVDSGPMHIAAGLKKPLLAVHTWSDPAKVGPYDPQAWILKDGRVYRRCGDAAPLPVAGMREVADFLNHQIAAPATAGDSIS